MNATDPALAPTDPVVVQIDVRIDLQDRLYLKRSDLQEIRRNLDDDDLTDKAIHEELNEWVSAYTNLSQATEIDFDWDAFTPDGRWADLEALYRTVRETPEPPPLPIIGQLNIEGNVYLGQGKRGHDVWAPIQNARTPRP